MKSPADRLELPLGPQDEIASVWTGQTGKPTMDFGPVHLTVSAHSFFEIECNVLKNTLLVN